MCGSSVFYPGKYIHAFIQMYQFGETSLEERLIPGLDIR